MAARPVAARRIHQPELDAVEPGPDPDHRAQGVGEEQAHLRASPDQAGALVRRLLGYENALVEEACGEIGDAGRAHSQMLADFHPRHGALPAQGIEKTPPGCFARGEGDCRHHVYLFVIRIKEVQTNDVLDEKII
jgi:hypothetical protein